MIEKSGGTTGTSWHDHSKDMQLGQSQGSHPGGIRAKEAKKGNSYQVKTTGWKPTCDHWEWHIGSKRASSYIGLPREPIPGIIYDPFFGGSGRVGKVALRLGCNFLGTELSQEYVDMANDEIKSPLAQKRLF